MHLPESSAKLGISDNALAVRIFILSAMDFVAAIGAGKACSAIYNNDKEKLKKAGVIAFIGFGLYGIYELYAAWNYLPVADAWAYTAFAFLYMFLGLTAYQLSKKYVKDWLSEEPPAAERAVGAQKKDKAKKK